MPKFFVEQITGETAVITGDEAVHIGKSLRMKPGDGIVLSCAGKDYDCEIARITPQEVFCRVFAVISESNEPTLQVTLFQAMPKSDKLEQIVQKATELGVTKIVPVMTARCIARPEPKQFSKRLERLQKIAHAAAKQSGRSIIPQVSEILNLNEALQQMCELDQALVCYEKGGESLRNVNFSGIRTAGIFTGSEGGFEQNEISACVAHGILPISLGKRILRCETAPLAAVSAVMLLSGNLD